MSSHASLSAAADERKARLAKLKSLKRKQPEQDEGPGQELAGPDGEQESAPAASASPPEKDVARLHLSGRNYDPETRGPKLGFENAPTMEGPTLEQQAAEVEAEVRREAAENDDADKGIDLFKLQPKKPNWDLKRELDRKMEVLNVRTDNAIARLVRERLASKKATDGGGGSAPAAGVDAGASGLDGAALVEGIRLREREEEEERRREREADEYD